MKKAYPVFIKDDSDFTLIYSPDFNKMTQAEKGNMYEVMEMARDLICSECLILEDNKKDLPNPSSYENAIKLVVTNIDKPSFQFSDGLFQYIDIDTLEYRKKYDNHIVRKNVSIPSWLNSLALEKGVNFSQVLQDALKEKINEVWK